MTVATLKPLPLLLMLTRTTSSVLLTFCCCLHKRKVAAQGAAAVVTDMSPLKTPMGWAQGTSTPLKVTLYLITLPPTLPKRIHPGHNSVTRPLFSLVPILTPPPTHTFCCFVKGVASKLDEAGDAAIPLFQVDAHNVYACVRRVDKELESLVVASQHTYMHVYLSLDLRLIRVNLQSIYAVSYRLQLSKLTPNTTTLIQHSYWFFTPRATMLRFPGSFVLSRPACVDWFYISLVCQCGWRRRSKSTLLVQSGQRLLGC